MQRIDLIRDLPRGTSRFFAYWPSHGVSFFAPVTTQRDQGEMESLLEIFRLP
jgi:hypothetical protein